MTENSYKENFYHFMDLLIASSPLFPSAGSRDKTGRAVVEVHGDRMGWTSPLVSAQSICELLLYLHSIPRYSAERLRCIPREKKITFLQLTNLREWSLCFATYGKRMFSVCQKRKILAGFSFSACDYYVMKRFYHKRAAAYHFQYFQWSEGSCE